MNKTEIFNVISRTAHKIGFKAKKHAPALLIVGGVVTMIGSAVGACVATRKLDGVLEETKKEIDTIHAKQEESKNTPETELVPYTDKQAKKDLTKAYFHCAGQVAKLYAAPVTFCALGTTSILSGANLFRKRNLALAAAYTSVSETFNRYSKGVIERFGEEMDKELRYGVKAKNIIETVVKEDGTEETRAEVVEEYDVLESDTDKFFDEFNINFDHLSAEENLKFLAIQQSVANEKLRRKGYLFLNDVYALIGIQPTKAGQAIGWIYDEKNPVGDNFIDFGLGNKNDPSVRRFVNGHEKAVLLHFNHDGNILNKDRPLFETV